MSANPLVLFRHRDRGKSARPSCSRLTRNLVPLSEKSAGKSAGLTSSPIPALCAHRPNPTSERLENNVV